MWFFELAALWGQKFGLNRDSGTSSTKGCNRHLLGPTSLSKLERPHHADVNYGCYGRNSMTHAGNKPKGRTRDSAAWLWRVEGYGHVISTASALEGDEPTTLRTMVCHRSYEHENKHCRSLRDLAKILADSRHGNFGRAAKAAYPVGAVCPICNLTQELFCQTDRHTLSNQSSPLQITPPVRAIVSFEVKI